LTIDRVPERFPFPTRQSAAAENGAEIVSCPFIGARYPRHAAKKAAMIEEIPRETNRSNAVEPATIPKPRVMYPYTMDHEEKTEWFLPSLRRSYARLAAWMTRGNRVPEHNRLPAPPRVERPARVLEPTRRPAPPRP